MSSDKPSTSDIIEELKSISQYLDEDNKHAEDIPLLTMVAEPLDFAPSEDTDAEPQVEKIADQASDSTRAEEDAISESNLPHSNQEIDPPPTHVADEDLYDEFIDGEEPWQVAAQDDIRENDDLSSGEVVIDDIQLEIPELGEDDGNDINEIKAAYEIEFATHAGEDIEPPLQDEKDELSTVRASTDETPAQTNSQIDCAYDSEVIPTANDKSVDLELKPHQLPDNESTIDNSSIRPVPLKEETQTKNTPDIKKGEGKRPHQASVKARGENPFLPPHIRKQLGKHKYAAIPIDPDRQKSEDDLLKQSAAESTPNHSQQKVEIQGDLLDGFKTLPTTTTHQEKALSSQDEMDIDALINEIVDAALPKLESQLRQALRKKFQNL